MGVIIGPAIDQEEQMADASQALGSPEVAGTFLSPKGMMKKMAFESAGRSVGGVVGAVGGNAAAAAGNGQGEGTPTFGQLGYLAVTGEEVALVRAKRGAIKPKIMDDVLGRKPRGDVQRVDFVKGSVKGELRIEFSDGGLWEFEVPKVHNKKAEKVVEALV
jgi:hypothetical protein